MIGVVLGIAILLFLVSGGVHKIEEGHIGLYWRGGALMPDHTEPGYHLMLPIITSVANIQTSVQTDRVENIPVRLQTIFNDMKNLNFKKHN
jgi:regulator of protease activity HflC (stomatin/prohibitin superfamily)